MQSIYWYVTAVYAKKFGVRLHAAEVMSTHMHEVLTDVRGELPAFVRDRNRALANALKRHRGWNGEVFERAQASYVELYGAEAIAAKIGYTIANCVEAGCVQHPDQWPGVSVSVNDIGERVIRVKRPDVYFNASNPFWPEEAEIRIEMPEAIERAYGDNARATLRTVVEAAIVEARRLAKAAGRVVRDIRRLTSIPFTHRATTPEPMIGCNPTFATAGNREQLEVALLERSEFHASYRRAFEAFKAGLRDVPFPIGTWRWCRELGARAGPALRRAAPFAASDAAVNA
jgi:putative transposase